jgi:hypothetical protein
MITPVKNPEHLGRFTVGITLTDDNPTAPLQSQYSFTITVGSFITTKTNSTSITANETGGLNGEEFLKPLKPE